MEQFTETDTNGEYKVEIACGTLKSWTPAAADKRNGSVSFQADHLKHAVIGGVDKMNTDMCRLLSEATPETRFMFRVEVHRSAKAAKETPIAELEITEKFRRVVALQLEAANPANQLAAFKNGEYGETSAPEPENVTPIAVLAVLRSACLTKIGNVEQSTKVASAFLAGITEKASALLRSPDLLHTATGSYLDRFPIEAAQTGDEKRAWIASASSFFASVAELKNAIGDHATRIVVKDWAEASDASFGNYSAMMIAA